MGEVGANATETTTTTADEQPKENGEVNGTEPAPAPEVVSLKKAAVVSASNQKGNSSTEGDSEGEAADDGEDGDVDGGQKTVVSSEQDADKQETEQEEETSKELKKVAKEVDAVEEQDEGEEKQTDGSDRGTATPPARAPSSERGSPKVTDGSDGDGGTQSKQPNSSSSNNKRRRSSSSSETTTTTTTMNSSRPSAENGPTKRPLALLKTTPSSSPSMVLPNLAEVTIEKLPQRKDDTASKQQKKVKVDGGGIIDLDLDDDDDDDEEGEAATRTGSGSGSASKQNGKELDGNSGDNGSVDRSSSVTQNGHQESEVEGDVVVQKTNAAKPKANRPVAVDTMAEEDEDDEEEDEEGEEDDDKPVSINSDSDGGSGVEGPAETDNQQHRSTAKPKLADEGEKQKKKKTEGGDRPPIPEDAVRVATPEVVQKALHSGTGGTGGSSKPSNGGFPVAISNQNGDGSGGDCDGDVTFLSDKEDDCVVIEDDEVDGELPPATGSTSMTEAGTVRSRSSASRSRRSLPPGIMLHAAGGAAPPSLVSTDDEDDDDDDIQEIIDDPLAPDTTGGAMRGSGSLLAAVGGGGQLGSFPVAYKGSSQKSLLMNSGGGASTGSGTGKDPPTLVIIDTNTLMNNQRSANVLGAAGSPATGMGNNASLLAKAAAMAAGGSPMGGGGAYGMAGNALAVAAAAAAAAGGQFVGNSRSLLNSVSPSATSAGVLMAGGNYAKVVAPPLTPVTPLLPALTDDMFVLEAPSFIVPYIYEKPPVDNLRDIVDDLEVHIKEMRKKLDESGGGSVDPLAATTVADAVEGADKKDAASNQQSAAADASATAEAGSAPDVTQKDRGRDTGRKRKRPTDDDDEWDELDTSTDDEASDEEHKTKVLIKEVKADMEHIILPSSEKDVLGGGGGGGGTGSGSTAGGGDAKKSENYFENPLGKFFMNIGINLVQEFVQTDLLRQQKRKRDREGKPSPSTQLAINSLMKNLEQSKENNKPYKFEVKRCEYCPFRSESSLVMAHHYETPHMRNFVYKCNFCAYETRPPHDILFHMEAVHNIKGRMEKALSYHHCPNCLFEDNGKSKLARHAVACAKKFRPEINLNPPVDWEPPAKIPRIKPKHGLVGTATAYQAMTAQQQKNLALANQQRINQQQQSVQLTQQHLAAHQALQQQQQQHHAQSLAAAQQHLGMVSVNAANVNNLANLSPAAQAAAMRARAVGTGGAGSLGGVGRAPSIIPSPTGITAAAAASLRTAGGGAGVNVAAAASAAIRNTLAGAGMVIPNNLQLSASALAAAAVAGGFSKYAPNSLNAGRSLLANTNSSITIQNVSNMKTTKTAQPPSISITPLPRQSSSNSANMANIAGALSKLQSQGTSAVKPGQIPGGGKTAFVVCEICDGYIKDLDQLRNHMQWIHKVKIHPKMIYNRPPLNCQKCQYRFFTDQGLERHLLGSHGLVTSSMQEAANKGKDAGRCPVCGRVYQWKLLNHVSRDHSMTLKPAHLSYKCTVCTATFGMYKQFESHVYSAHSTVAKKTVDSKGKGGGNVQQSAMNLIGNSAASSAGSGTSSSGMRGGGGGGDSLLKPLKINDEITIIPQPTSNSSKMMKTIELESHVID